LARPQSGEHRTVAVASFATESAADAEQTEQTDQVQRNEVLFRVTRMKTRMREAAASQSQSSYISGRKSGWYCTVDFDP
jgi:hypothetical protein